MIKNFEELKQTTAKCASCLSAKFTGSDGKRHIVLCGGTGCLSSRADEITALFNKLVEEKNLGDKVTEDEKAPVKEAIEKLKTTIAGGDTEAIKADTDALQKAFYPIAEKLYAQAQQEQLEDIGYAEKSEVRLMIEKFVDENPDAVANLLRNWLNEEWD